MFFYFPFYYTRLTSGWGFNERFCVLPLAQRIVVRVFRFMRGEGGRNKEEIEL